MEEDDLAGEQSRKTLPKNLIARNTRAGVSMQGVGFRRPALPISVRAEVRDGNGQRATRQEERRLNVFSQVWKEWVRMVYIDLRRKHLIDDH